MNPPEHVGKLRYLQIIIGDGLYGTAVPLDSFGISAAFPPLPGFTPLARSYLHTPRILRWMRPRARREYERCVRIRTEAWRAYVLSRAEKMMQKTCQELTDIAA
ncbi:MAG: hypothetical protein WC455_29255 [Dehalococcoidia bacterium]|jgi:hypothetical protein